MTYCLRLGPPAAPTFTPMCMLQAGHDGECNWAERVAIRAKLIADAAAVNRRQEASDGSQ